MRRQIHFCGAPASATIPQDVYLEVVEGLRVAVPDAGGWAVYRCREWGGVVLAEFVGEAATLRADEVVVEAPQDANVRVLRGL